MLFLTILVLYKYPMNTVDLIYSISNFIHKYISSEKWLKKLKGVFYKIEEFNFITNIHDKNVLNSDNVFPIMPCSLHHPESISRNNVLSPPSKNFR